MTGRHDGMSLICSRGDDCTYTTAMCAGPFIFVVCLVRGLPDVLPEVERWSVQLDHALCDFRERTGTDGYHRHYVTSPEEHELQFPLPLVDTAHESQFVLRFVPQSGL